MSPKEKLPELLQQIIEAEAIKYRDEDFERNPNGYTIAPYVNEETIAHVFFMGAQRLYSLLQSRGAKAFDEEPLREHYLNELEVLEDGFSKWGFLTIGARWQHSVDAAQIEAQSREIKALKAERDTFKHEFKMLQAGARRPSALLAEAEKALERIGRPSDCGCVPCRGRCENLEGLIIERDEIKSFANVELAKIRGPK